MPHNILITGASSGIGRSFAKALALRGHHVILVSRDKAKLEQLANELSAAHGVDVTVIPMNLTIPGAAAALYQETEAMGISVDWLINNAGFGLSGEFLSHTAEEYQQQIALNIGAVVELTHLYLPGMVNRKQGAIINVASLLAFLPFPYCSVYSASKAFVLSFTEALWEEYRHHGIRVLALCPGPTDTRFFEQAREVETKNKRTPEQVVATALAALKHNRSFVIDGASNRMLAFMGRIFSRSGLAKMLGAQMRKSIAAKPKR
ncbi:hypothetical protein FHS18_003070 [Paenibacillus phyllosphaerae]|uniref:Oxidoreductase n=1 Tax=Paenibacillus phyllosphaerae TaxID=274593 RepID=A0A7W5AYN2_9BACL|nr:SDR family oxidoreductase [Paenibacillus phyllosphaerae]MBB3111002.1 hypothetical protein [Paenibacillus phyllosphaerae]